MHTPHRPALSYIKYAKYFLRHSVVLEVKQPDRSLSDDNQSVMIRKQIDLLDDALPIVDSAILELGRLSETSFTSNVVDLVRKNRDFQINKISMSINLALDIAMDEVSRSQDCDPLILVHEDYMDKSILEIFSERKANDISENITACGNKYSTFISLLHIVKLLIESNAQELGIRIFHIEKNQIRREICFPPELKQAGLSILSYFSEIIHSKYPEVDVGITIEQRDDRVILEIETPEGKKKQVERILQDYSLVVTGQMRPDQFLEDKTDIILLEHKLDMAKMEIKHSKEFLRLTQDSYKDRIVKLEEETEFLRKALDQDRTSLNKFIDDMRRFSSSVNKTSSRQLSSLLTLLESGLTKDNEEEAVRQLSLLKREDPNTFEKIHELLLKGAAQGAAGNFLYVLLQSLARIG